MINSIDFSKFNPDFERKATKGELREAQIVFNRLEVAGLSATYAGGKGSKGHGFWVRGYGYLTCNECVFIIKNVA